MIRQSESAVDQRLLEGERPHKDNALWGPTGWVHVEKDIDFSDPRVCNYYF